VFKTMRQDIFTEEHKMFRAQRRFVDASGHNLGTATR